MVREKSGDFDRSSKGKSLITLQVQLDDLSFCQNTIYRSHGKFSEARNTSGKSQESCKSKSGHPEYVWYPLRNLSSI